MEHETLASELLHELKMQSKRWFIAFIVALVLWFATIGVFIWYVSLPVEEYDTYIEQESTNKSFNIAGGNYNGSTSEGEEVVQTEG